MTDPIIDPAEEFSYYPETYDPGKCVSTLRKKLDINIYRINKLVEILDDKIDNENVR